MDVYRLMVIDPCVKYDMPKSKLIEVDLEVKNKGHTGVMNVHNTLSHHGDIPAHVPNMVCQLMSQQREVTSQTRICTDR